MIVLFFIPTSWDIVSVVNIWAVDPRTNRIQREHEMIRWPLSSRHLQGREVARGVACFARFDVAANGRGRREPLGAWSVSLNVLLGYFSIPNPNFTVESGPQDIVWICLDCGIQ